jgi:hypothetical protein
MRPLEGIRILDCPHETPTSRDQSRESGADQVDAMQRSGAIA